jgi:hypothetical protein
MSFSQITLRPSWSLGQQQGPHHQGQRRNYGCNRLEPALCNFSDFAVKHLQSLFCGYPIGLTKGQYQVHIVVLLQNVDVLKDQDAVKQLASILKTNVRACKALGHPYVLQVSNWFIFVCLVSILQLPIHIGFLSLKCFGTCRTFSN